MCFNGERVDAHKPPFDVLQQVFGNGCTHGFVRLDCLARPKDHLNHLVVALRRLLIAKTATRDGTYAPIALDREQGDLLAVLAAAFDALVEPIAHDIAHEVDDRLLVGDRRLG